MSVKNLLGYVLVFARVGHVDRSEQSVWAVHFRGEELDVKGYSCVGLMFDYKVKAIMHFTLQDALHTL